MEKINQLYTLSELKSGSSAGGLIYELVNLNLYVVKVSNQPSIAKWLLLNQSFKEAYGTGADLLRVKRDDIVWLKLTQVINPKQLQINEEAYKCL